MIRFWYTPGFTKQYADLSPALKEEVRKRISLFRSDLHDPSLHTHKLQGRLKGRWSFRVNYSYRIVFCYDTKNSIAFLSVGDHDVYQ